MKCDKCIGGIIMKQIAIAEYTEEPCDCYMENWFSSIKRSK